LIDHKLLVVEKYLYYDNLFTSADLNQIASAL